MPSLLLLRLCLAPQDVSNMLWALATARHHAPGLLVLLEDAATAVLEHMEPRHVATTAWALAAMCRPAAQLYAGLYAHSWGGWCCGRFLCVCSVGTV